MGLVIVPPTHVDWAWKDGASSLAEVCKLVDEITGDQLKMILAKGERTLVRIDNDGETVGWGAFRIDQLPNVRVLHITDLYAPGGHFESFFDEIKSVAKSVGCSRIRCAAQKAQARLYRAKCGFEPIYEILEAEIS